MKIVHLPNRIHSYPFRIPTLPGILGIQTSALLSISGWGGFFLCGGMPGCHTNAIEMESSSPELLAALQQDLQIFKKPLGEAADTIVDEGVSKYPIFIVHQQQMDMGIPIIEAGPASNLWAVNASTLEEFVTKNVIEEKNAGAFMEIFKPVGEQLCLFVLSQVGATFVFLPRDTSTHA